MLQAFGASPRAVPLVLCMAPTPTHVVLSVAKVQSGQGFEADLKGTSAHPYCTVRG
jgi:hypothetical protein